MERSWQSYAGSSLAHVCAAGLLLALSVPVVQRPRKPAATVALIAPALHHAVSIAPPHPRHEAKVTAPRTGSLPVAIPKLAPVNPPPAAMKPVPRAVQAILEAPKALNLKVPLQVPPPVAELPVAPQIAVRTGAFEQAAAPAETTTAHALSVGAFGDGNGARPGGEARGNAPAVRLGGFGDQTTPPPGNRPAIQPKTNPYTPVEILFKPKPVYTVDARNSGVEGEVSLEVVFLATGEIQVGRVVHGLGHGLDQAAQQAAALVRFKPATRGGVPVDTPATIRITFELS